MPNARVATGVPVRILVARDGPSFGAWLPNFHYDKRSVRQQPPGLIFFGSEKTYIGIRANRLRPFSPTLKFIRITRAGFERQSYRNLPPWLEEGYSTVYGSLTFSDTGAA